MSSFFVDKKIYKERLDICRGCDKYIKVTGNCSVCLCFMRVKASIGQMSCPEKKWVATGVIQKIDEIPKHLKKEAKEIWKDIEKGIAKDMEAKHKAVELYNTIYGGSFKKNSNCGSCLNTVYEGIKRIINENN
jgi:hypothetical protein